MLTCSFNGLMHTTAFSFLRNQKCRAIYFENEKVKNIIIICSFTIFCDCKLYKTGNRSINNQVKKNCLTNLLLLKNLRVKTNPHLSCQGAESVNCNSDLYLPKDFPHCKCVYLLLDEKKCNIRCRGMKPIVKSQRFKYCTFLCVINKKCLMS